jgi:hypothetical protein
MLCYTDLKIQAFSRKEMQKQSKETPTEADEGCVCDTEAGLWVTPALEGIFPQFGASRPFAADARAGFTLPPVQPVAVPGCALGLTRPSLWYCRATLAFTQALRAVSGELLLLSVILRAQLRSFRVVKRSLLVGRWERLGVRDSGGGLRKVLLEVCFHRWMLDRNSRFMISSSATPIW